MEMWSNSEAELRRRRRSPSLERPSLGEQTPSNKDPSDLKIVLLGKTGVGKSSSGNTILGENRFIVKRSLSSVTKQCSLESSEVEGRHVSVIDTPGFFDLKLSEEELMTEMAKSVFLSAPVVHAFIFILPFNRVTKQETDVITEIKEIFGEDVMKHVIILFTYGDDIEQETFESEIRGFEDFNSVIQSCGGYHLFNNKHLNNRKQVRDLLQKIDTMIEKNGGNYYTNEMMEEAKRLKQERQTEEAKSESAFASFL